MTLQFPAWFWRCYLSSSFTYAPIRGPEINLKIPRTVDWTCRLWESLVDGGLRFSSCCRKVSLRCGIYRLSVALAFTWGRCSSMTLGSSESAFHAEYVRRTAIAGLPTDKAIILVVMDISSFTSF